MGWRLGVSSYEIKTRFQGDNRRCSVGSSLCPRAFFSVCMYVCVCELLPPSRAVKVSYMKTCYGAGKEQSVSHDIRGCHNQDWKVKHDVGGC